MRLAAFDFSVFEYHASVYKDVLPIYFWILIFAVSAHAYAYVHMDS